MNFSSLSIKFASTKEMLTNSCFESFDGVDNIKKKRKSVFFNKTSFFNWFHAFFDHEVLERIVNYIDWILMETRATLKFSPVVYWNNLKGTTDKLTRFLLHIKIEFKKISVFYILPHLDNLDDWTQCVFKKEIFLLNI